MNILLDTNVLLNIIRANDYPGILNFINPDKSLIYISIVSEAEIRSIAIRKKWGLTRLAVLNDFLDQANIIEVGQPSVNIYAQIDTYSQRLNPNFDSYPFDTPRNMGKNDLWIASLASMLNLKLITTDADFEHLNNVFIDVRKINPADFIPYR